jgi:putative transposase
MRRESHVRFCERLGVKFPRPTYRSGANTAAIESVKADAYYVDILMRQNKYLNNIVEQDHRAIKRITRPMLGFKSFWSARIIIAGIETMHMIRKGQLDCPGGQPVSVAGQFYSLAA